MHLIELPDTKKKLYQPSNLSECDARQYIEICELIFKYHTSTLSYDAFCYQAVYKLHNMKPKQNGNEVIEENKMVNIMQLAELVSNFFEDNQEDQKVIKQDYTNNPVVSFAPAFKRLYGPTDGFQNMKFGEYVTVLRLFLDFSADQNTKTLYELAATLYRPKKHFHFIKKLGYNYDGDCRVPYNAVHTDKYLEILKHAPMGFIYGVYLFFGSMQKFITSAQIPWAGKVLDFSILFDGDGNSKESEFAGLGMDAVMLSMAEGGSFGKLNEVMQTPFWTIMIKMYDIRIRNLEEQKMYNDAKNK